jgi:ABC-2 type transport system permease protein
MSAENSLIPVREEGWRCGLSNLMHNEFEGWWGSRRWLSQAAIWLVTVNGMLCLVLFTPTNPTETSTTPVPILIFNIMLGVFASMGAIISMQGAVIGERQSGTVAWILSKPVSREAFLLSKLLIDDLGFLVSMVLIQGAIAYALMSYKGIALQPATFLAALGMLYLHIVLYSTLTVMLGVVLDKRGAVLGIAIAFLLIQQQFAQSGLGIHLPGALPYAAADVMAGKPLPSAIAILSTAVLIVVFVCISFWKFRREEF